MRKTLIGIAIAVLGAGAATAFAQPTLDFTPNRVWRNAPESKSVEARRESASEQQSNAATEKRQPTSEAEQK